MKLSVYKLANYSAKSKEDKSILSRLASSPNIPDTVEIENEDQLIDIITNYAWSPSVFSGVRHSDNFISADFLAIDFDNGYRIEQAEKLVASLNLCALGLPSSSHTPEHHKFRLVFPLAKTIFSQKVYDDTWDYLHNLFPMLDQSCSDLSRFFIRCSMEDGFFQIGDFLTPVDKPEEKEETDRYEMSDVQITVTEDIKDLVKQIYGKERETVPESVEFFLVNSATGLPGMWINALNRFVFSLALSGVDDIIIWQVIEQLAPNPLDKKDNYQINRSIRDGKRSRNQI